MNTDQFNAGQKAAEDLLSGLNCCSSNSFGDGFVEGILRGHRTLQQSVFREVIVPLIERKAEAYADGRDQASKDLCIKLTKVTKESGLPFI